MKKYVIFTLISIIVVSIGITIYHEYIIKSNNFGSNNFNARDSNFKEPDLMGEISAITKNVVTLKVINRDKPNNGSINTSQNQDTNNESFIPVFSFQYTGESQDITIPNDFKIFNNRDQSNYLTINDLKVGDILSITYKEDKSTINNIRLFKQRAKMQDTTSQN